MLASSGPDSQPGPLAWQYDLKTRRTFLKRCDYPSVGMAQLFKGSIITVYSRQLKIVEYADSFTERQFAKTSQFTVAMVMQEAMGDLGKIVDSVQREGFVITEMRLLRAKEQMCVAMKLTAEDAVAKWQVTNPNPNPNPNPNQPGLASSRGSEQPGGCMWEPGEVAGGRGRSCVWQPCTVQSGGAPRPARSGRA